MHTIIVSTTMIIKSSNSNKNLLFNSVLFYVPFFQTGAHNPLQSKEQNSPNKKQTKQKIPGCTHTHTVYKTAWRGDFKDDLKEVSVFGDLI